MTTDEIIKVIKLTKQHNKCQYSSAKECLYVEFCSDCDKYYDTKKWDEFCEQLPELLEELKAYKELDLEIPQHFTKEQSDWIKAYVILKKKEAKAETIDEYYKEMRDMIEGNEEFIDWQKYEILQCNYLVKEQLKEQK